MEFKLYQIESNLVKKGSFDLLFMGYSFFESLNLPNFNMKDLGYQMVYSGEVNAENGTISTLESVYSKFNMNHPADFKGHSLSVSDIVEINGEFYYCDSFGWEKIENIVSL